MTYLRIRNLGEYQHYTNRRPPWVKLYQSVLEDPDFTRLQDASKWLALALVLVASRCDNRIPFDVEWIARTCQMTTVPDIDALLSAGWLEAYEEDGRKQSASKTLASCKGNLMPREERREKREERTEQQKKKASATRPKVEREAEPPAQPALSLVPPPSVGDRPEGHDEEQDDGPLPELAEHNGVQFAVDPLWHETVHAAWENYIGPVNYPRLRKALAPAMEPKGGPQKYPTYLLIRAIEWYAAIRRPTPREWSQVKPEQFAAGLSGHIAIALMPPDQRLAMIPQQRSA